MGCGRDPEMLLHNPGGRRELCSLTQQRKVQKDENIVYIRDSWGNTEPGAYWMRGNYEWEAYINNTLAGSTQFYVEDLGPSAPGENKYFDIQHFKLFEGDARRPPCPTKNTCFNSMPRKPAMYGVNFA